MHAVVQALTEAVGPERVSTTDSVLDQHGGDEGYPERRRPLAVVFAESTADVQATLAVARAHGVAVIPYGAGSSLEGALVPLQPAVSLDLSRMNRVLEVRPQDFLAVVEPGLTHGQLNRALRHHGLFFPVDPGADASLGGMAATNASGTTTVRYGGMRHNVLSLQVVLADGQVLELGRPVRKTSSGYDLKDLFIGSEGTLGVITRLGLRLHPLPAHVHTARAFFPTVEQASQAAYEVMALGLPVARLELVDDLTLRALNAFLHRKDPERPALFLEFHSSTEAALRAEVEAVSEVCRQHGGEQVEAAHSPEERSALWEARHKAYWAVTHAYPGCAFLTTDVAVPLSHLPELVRFARTLLREMDLAGGIVGHVGDGNFHVLVATPPDRYPQAEAYSERLVQRALEVGGTATGEHGVGLRKRKFLAAEHGAALEWMRRVKALLDPQGLLNPGKGPA